MENIKVITLTKELLYFTDVILQQFEETKREGKERDFYREVMPFAKKVQFTLDQWFDLVQAWLKEHEHKYLNSNQVLNAKEQLEKVAIQAFFPNTSKKKFLDSIQAIKFIFSSIMYEAEGSNKQN